MFENHSAYLNSKIVPQHQIKRLLQRLVKNLPAIYADKENAQIDNNQ